MALSGAVLKSLIVNNLTALGRGGDKIDQAGIEAIANAIIQHITTASVVNTAVTGSCSTGPVTGVGVGTIT